MPKKAKGKEKPSLDPTGRGTEGTGRGDEPKPGTRPGRNGGTLVQYQPGSNGGVHRGPDKFPRRNAVRAQYLGALTGQGGGWPVLDAQGRVKIGEDGRVVMVDVEPTRAIHASALAYKVIFARAERGLDLEVFLRMQRDAHEALQPGKDEAAKDGKQGPIRPVCSSGRRRAVRRQTLARGPAPNHQPVPLTVTPRSRSTAKCTSDGPLHAQRRRPG